jgi:hypothetical protein
MTNSPNYSETFDDDPGYLGASDRDELIKMGHATGIGEVGYDDDLRLINTDFGTRDGDGPNFPDSATGPVI